MLLLSDLLAVVGHVERCECLDDQPAYRFRKDLECNRVVSPPAAWISTTGKPRVNATSPPIPDENTANRMAATRSSNPLSVPGDGAPKSAG